MNEHIIQKNAPLVYNGVVVETRSDMLSLTDMWRAAGSQSGRAPSDWGDLASTKEFVAAVEASFNAGKSGIITKKGRNGGTWAHWQIGLAYAKYLSPEFHMWCNSVVRDRMEGRIVPVGNGPVTPITSVALAREGRLTFKLFASVAKQIGLTGNQAVLSANQATVKATGFNVMSLLGITHIDAEVNQPDIIPGEIARRLGMQNAQEANKALVRFGYQSSHRDGRGRLYYELTPKGDRAGGVFKDTDKRTGHGTPVKQLMWASKIVDLLRADMDQRGV